MRRIEPPSSFGECPVIAVLRGCKAEQYDRVINVLKQEGIRAIELTLSTPGTLERLEELYEFDLDLGVGTITTVEEAQMAIERGASFLVTPVMITSVVELGLRFNVPVFPGGLTPTELHAGWVAGATAVKVFPAETVGPAYGQHLRGPFPDLQFVPSGGVSLASIPDWLGAGAMAVSIGGPLVGDSIKGGDLDALRSRARSVVAATTIDGAAAWPR